MSAKMPFSEHNSLCSGNYEHVYIYVIGSFRKLWTALEEKLSSLSITDKSTPVALADHTS